MLNIGGYTLSEIKNGYVCTDRHYECILCGMQYLQGEIYLHANRYWDAQRMMEHHIDSEHNGMLHTLLQLDKKESGLTDAHKELIHRTLQGQSDKEIAHDLNISPSTVRHQRYTLRERAKQAKIFLALNHLIENNTQNMKSKPLNTVHKGATMVDERYFYTEEEKNKVIKNNLISVNPLVLRNYPAKEKKKLIILGLVIDAFEKERKYTEKEVNAILKPMYEDYVLIRRYLIEYGFMDRTKDCREYWVK